MTYEPTLLVTGGAGFIGSNFILHYLHEYPNSHILNVDKLTYAGDLSNLSAVENMNQYQFIQSDIADVHQVDHIFTDFNVTGVINFAAESHVDRSIESSADFVRSNVLGIQTLLQAALTAWERDGVLAENRFHHISTDEVFGSIEDGGKFTEDSPYDPRNPYSASKASSDMLVRSFGYTYGMNVVISNCSNNYGPRQYKEKLIPTIVSNALAGNPIPIYGDGGNIRDWLYVADHCQALDLIFHHARPMMTYTIGGNHEQTNIEMVTAICHVLDHECPNLLGEYNIHSFKDLMTFVTDRKGHDRHYAIDDTKLRRDLGWRSQTTLKQGLEKTVKWYINKWTTKTAQAK